MAITAADCISMIEAASKAKKELFVIKQNRYNPPVVFLKRLLDDNKLGEIFNVQVNCFWNRQPEYYKDSWRGSLELDGGTLFTQFSHFVDLLYWMIGEVKSVSAILRNFSHKGIIEFEDTGIVSIEFTNGVIGSINYTVNSYERNMEGSITIFGSRGTVKVGGQYLNKLEYCSIEGVEEVIVSEGNPANDYGSYQGSMSNHDKVYDNLIDILQNDAPPTSSHIDGLKTVEIIEKIYNSAKRI
jgi:predicted dehydrogenase